MSAEDLYQAGMEHAVRLAPEYRAGLGVGFVSFVWLRVKRAMHQAVARDARERAFGMARGRGVRFAREDAGFRRGARAEAAHWQKGEDLAREAMGAGVLAGLRCDARSPEELAALQRKLARWGVEIPPTPAGRLHTRGQAASRRARIEQ